MSRVIVRKHWLSESARSNIDTIQSKLEKRPDFTFGALLFYAFTPLPSNDLFIAYGLTTMNLLRIAIPFLLGFVSDGDALGYFSLHFVATQCLLLAAVYAFTRIDWQSLLHAHKWRWLPKPEAIPQTRRDAKRGRKLGLFAS